MPACLAASGLADGCRAVNHSLRSPVPVVIISTSRPADRPQGKAPSCRPKQCKQQKEAVPCASPCLVSAIVETVQSGEPSVSTAAAQSATCRRAPTH